LSPDGKRVAFHLASPEGYQVWTSDVDGGNRVRTLRSRASRNAYRWPHLGCGQWPRQSQGRRGARRSERCRHSGTRACT
jgi:hypothetical protein